MKLLPTLALTLALGFGTTAALYAQDEPVEAQTEKKSAKPAVTRTPRLTGVWGKMGSLTPEQKTQIAAIHKKALADKKAIDAQEQTDIMALMTPEQKAEVEKITEDAAAARKKTAAKPGAEPATQPAEDGM
ncbi:MAG TPA: hypothetical protein VF595_01360 [Tepidisphaeraceae bacterium]|jgi:hypothetical protein